MLIMTYNYYSIFFSLYLIACVITSYFSYTYFDFIPSGNG